MHHLHGPERAGKTQLACPGWEPCSFASTGSTGHPVQFFPLMPRGMDGHNALGHLVTRMGRGRAPNYLTRTRGSQGILVARQLLEDPDHVRGKARGTPKFVNGNYGRKGACFRLVAQSPEPHSYLSPPEQREGQHRNPRSQEVQPPTLAAGSRGVGKRLIQERVREKSGPRSHSIKGRSLRMREVTPLWSSGNCSFSTFLPLHFPSVAPGSEAPARK